MDETKKWTWRWPIKLTESRIRGVYEHLRSKHKAVEIAACDMIEDRERVDLEDLINGHIWVQTEWVRFKCTEPNLLLVFQDEPRCTAELRWGPDAEESAKVVMEHVKNCFAPLQLLCHTGLFISVPFILNALLAGWSLTKTLQPQIAASGSAAVSPGAPHAEVGGWLSWGVPLGAVLVFAAVGVFLVRLRWIRVPIEFLFDQYFLLFPAVFFDLKWTSHHSDAARVAGISTYLGFVYWLLAT